ncbi:MAG: Muramoyltetrapeptide carboxypeptidase [uncultured Sphingomonadaceae bacterium]|uniref:Muramoyltetrapeptide carboxypeptidase n=1 Tax=uncultured Sphingomonadaceae bacterium TaxID=169976 RepID=A0A6J4SKC4_9SPHN|nr:MAG: Muramoyltetrapeptide carboxypeptidase [uncultured Sphingomonadaceae bacterium]
MRIAIVAPSCPATEVARAKVDALAARDFPAAELRWHPQCFLRGGHFAGPDAARADSLVEVANDPAVDAVWFARGGYGAVRIAGEVLARLGSVAADKRYMGYSDGGTLLGAFHAAGLGRPTWGPMPQDVLRPGGEAAVARGLGWLLRGDRRALEPSVRAGVPRAAFNLTILAHLMGTPWLPDLSGHELLLEEVSEPTYRFDRAFGQLAASGLLERSAGLRLGRVNAVVPNEPAFGEEEEEIAQGWCARAGAAWLGRADIGHDVDNKVVPFGAG